ncbi:hypothetical protein SAMN05192563_104357 [Paraburkholderia aspalathi]|uniref:Uncharacterized protein n=1 Tax=Paraburkholderia aspalathi TaxID=1324617 RepID=A0A1I7EPS1_9BURK|nr:hypothetical protein SAMN05192563_104357 [Paraburkholderia aspalathi]
MRNQSRINQYDFGEARAGPPRETNAGLHLCQSRTVWTGPHPAISGTEVSMESDSTAYVSPDFHVR